jgi:hypothetical protein
MQNSALPVLYTLLAVTLVPATPLTINNTVRSVDCDKEYRSGDNRGFVIHPAPWSAAAPRCDGLVDGVRRFCLFY